MIEQNTTTEIPNIETLPKLPEQNTTTEILNTEVLPKLPEDSPTCSLCNRQVKVLERRGKNTGCRECLNKITNPLRNLVIRAGRNEPCPCKSGKKFKKCCGKEQ